VHAAAAACKHQALRCSSGFGQKVVAAFEFEILLLLAGNWEGSIPRGFLDVTHDLAAAEAMNSVEYLRPRINTVYYYVLAMSNEYLFHITPRTI
jgi:hypothetical protein